MLAVNKDKITALEQNKFFNHTFTNKIGLEFVQYMLKTKYHTLMNPDPVDPNKNTLAKELNYIKVIDSYINKPLDEYTFEDVEGFIMDFKAGKINKQRTFVKREGKSVTVTTEQTNEPRKLNGLARYVSAFKRFWRIYREYGVHNIKDFDILGTQWGLNLRPPKTKYEYEDYPIYTLNQIIQFAESLCKFEYTARTLLSINLMGRKCELTNLKYKDIEFRENGSIWVRLPNIKKNSSNKVPVELYDYCVKRLKTYLATADLKPNDLLFPSKETAFAKELKKKSQAFFEGSKPITPKTLRKLGVCVARELNISRDKVEDIGGWTRNSPVLEHYFKRVGVARGEDTNAKINKTEYVDVYAQMDKMKEQLKQMKEFQQAFVEKMQREQNVNISKDTQEIKRLIKALHN